MRDSMTAASIMCSFFCILIAIGLNADISALVMSTSTFHRRLLSLLLIASLGFLASCQGPQMSPAPPAASRYSAEAGARIQDRPGLGTQAGHEYVSEIQPSHLIRKSSVPDVVDSFHYNDAAGADTMAGILGGGKTRHNGLFDAAGDRLKVGLVSYSDPFPHLEAAGRRIVIGQAGRDYRVRLENRSKKRVEVIVTVDGLNTLTSTKAGYSQRGYILEPKQTYDVEGFRNGGNKVRTFRFGRVVDSVAAAKGGAGNVGVIGLAVFEEDEAKAKAALQHEQFVRDNASAFPGSR
jgi:hypothetical protein